MTDHEWPEPAEGAYLHAESIALEPAGPNPSWGQLADAQGRVDALLTQLSGDYDAVIARLETENAAKRCKVAELKAGWLIDLEGDPYADPDCAEVIYQTEGERVGAVYDPAGFDAAKARGEHDANDAYRPPEGGVVLWCQSDSWIAFPADHEVRVLDHGWGKTATEEAAGS